MLVAMGAFVLVRFVEQYRGRKVYFVFFFDFTVVKRLVLDGFFVYVRRYEVYAEEVLEPLFDYARERVLQKVHVAVHIGAIRVLYGITFIVGVKHDCVGRDCYEGCFVDGTCCHFVLLSDLILHWHFSASRDCLEYVILVKAVCDDIVLVESACVEYLDDLGCGIGS